ncbi:hypothetical protein [Streptomyces sp. NPDC026659]|uniref:hypothetical protein n=1 Tax=Streptomyces sp. NPDC026659 TaxID=3155123 RepID=UPI0033FB1E88
MPAPEEHDEGRVLPLVAWQPIMTERDFARLGAVVEARSNGVAAYFDSGDWETE